MELGLEGRVSRGRKCKHLPDDLKETRVYWKLEEEALDRTVQRTDQVLDDIKEKRGYWKLREEALDRTLWRTRRERVCGPVVRKTTEKL